MSDTSIVSEVKVIQDLGNEVVIEMPIGAMPRGEYKGIDKNGADVYAPKYPTEILSTDKKVTAGAYQQMSLFTVEKDCPCFEITAGQYKAILSSNESVAVFDKDGAGIVKCKPVDALGKYVPVIKKDPTVGIKGDYATGWWIGMLISDGWITGNMIGLAKLEDEKRNEFVRIARHNIEENFTVNTYVQEKEEGKLGNSCKVHLCGKDLVNKVSAWGFYKEGIGSLHKTIPADYLYNGTEECLLGILAGLLDGDGSISKNMSTKNPRFSCRVSTSSIYLVESLKTLMFRLGIRWSNTVTPPRGHSKVAYTFSPSTVDIRKILPRLNLIGKRENALKAEWLASASHRDYSVVPLQTSERDILCKICLAEKLNSFYGNLRQAKQALSYTVIEKHKELLEKHCPAILERAYSNILWEEVTDVVDAGVREVYDVEVPETKVFAVNGGLVVYDTASYSVPVSSKAVTEAIQKMMPERNLLTVRSGDPTYVPSSEVMQGTYLATRAPQVKPAVTFGTKAEAMAAYKKGEIKVDDPIIILQD
jgi:intein/homing endonuclease